MAGGSDEATTSNRSSTALATLFTFCPPGPDARTNRSTISFSSTAIESVIRIDGTRIAPFLHMHDERLRHLEAAKVETPIGPLDDVVVVSKGDVPIGKLEGIIVDPAERHVRYYVVESRDWFRTHRYLVPDAPHHIDWNRRALQVEMDEAALSKLPELRDDEFPPFSADDLR